MSRVNIEDSLFKDPRWYKLLIKCGDQYKALGMITTSWMLAQKHWLEHGCIPSKAWLKDLDLLIEIEFAEKREDGSVYVKGSKRAFEWLRQKAEAGRKGGQRKARNKLAGASGCLAGSSGAKPLTLTLTPTLLPAATPDNMVLKNAVKDFMTWWNKAAEQIDIIKVHESPDNVALIARHIAQNPDMEYWKMAINAISLDSFYQGKNRSKSKMNIVWFFKNRTVADLLDVHETKKDLFKGVLDD